MSSRATSKQRFLFPLVMAAVFLFLFAIIFATVSGVHAQAPTPGETTSPYITVINTTTSDGTQLTDTIINGPPTPPPGYEAQRAAVTNIPENATIINTPAYTWVFGCSSVSAAMIAGYYDRNGYPNMYTGPTAGGVMPLTDGSWPTWSDGYATYPNNPLIASHNGVDGRTVKGSIDDYWVKYGSSAQDPYQTGSWTQHTWGTAIGDYMKTSQYAYNNTDGSTSFWNYTSSATKLACAAMPGLGVTNDGTYGRMLFYQARGYTVTDCFNQNTDNNASGGFSMANFRTQIDAGHPVLLNLAGHSIVGAGYDSASSNTIYVHDTWDTSTHTMTWGTSYSGMQLQSVSIVNLAASAPVVVPTPISPSGTISDTTPTFTWSKISGATSYQLAVYNGSSLAYPVKTVAASACGSSATNCSNTPTTALSYAAHTWKVQAYVGGAWKGWSALKAFTITNIPTPKSPSGTIYVTKPTFTWSRISGATQYQFAVYKGSSSTPTYTKTVATSVCGSSTVNCSNTPTTALSATAYKWKVRAYVGGAWRAFSASKAFTVATSTAFDSEFTTDAAGWTPVNGTWTVGSGYYQTVGISNSKASTMHSNNYPTLTYEVKMMRKGCTTCANLVYVRGSPTPLDSAGGWYDGYRFTIANDGQFNIGYNQNGTFYWLVDWSTSSAITSSWNTLKVTMKGTFVQFYINGTRVAYGNVSIFSTGRVGISVYNDTSSGNHLYVDYAKLSLTAPTSSGPGEGISLDRLIGRQNLGGNPDIAP